MENTTKCVGRFLVDSAGRSYWSASGKPDESGGPPVSEEVKAPADGAEQITSKQEAPESEQSLSTYTGELLRHDPVPKKPVAAMSFGGRVRIARLHDSHEEFLGQVIRVGGWARNTRAAGGAHFCFVELNDGSCFKTLQVVVDKAAPGFDEVNRAIVGASFCVTGTLIVSPAKGQAFELQVQDPEKHSATVLGHNDATYPLQGRPKPETLREHPHLRARSNLFGAITRVKNNLAYSTHEFF